MNPNPAPAIADAVRRALIEAAESAYEDAGIRGLCEEGRWEAAISAMRALDVEEIARQADASADPHPSAGG
ncbi:MAG TPA: hypothetical protein VHG08_04650 [Longimicrobium sp.]|nr:hypothetical protein [Longimicrobium sp.]